MDVFAQYIKEIGKYEYLSKEQEKELIKKAKKNKKYFDDFVKRNLLLVVNIAHEFKSQEYGLEDLVQDGNIGLIYAIEKFDPDRGTRFSTYASFWIRYYITNSLFTKRKSIKMAPDKEKMVYSIKKKRKKIYDEIGEKIDIEEICKELNISKKTLKSIKDFIDCSFISKDSEKTIEPFYKHRHDEKCIEKIDSYLLSKEMEYFLENYGERNSFIIKSFYGICGFDKMTIREIASILGITSSRTAQIKDNIVLSIIKKHGRKLQNYITGERYGYEKCC